MPTLGGDLEQIGPFTWTAAGEGETAVAKVAADSQAGDPAGNTLLLPPGSYGFSTLTAPDLHDEISWVAVQDGYEMEVWQDVSGGSPAGNSKTFTGNVGFVGSEFNDEISFIEVRPAGGSPPSPEPETPTIERLSWEADGLEVSAAVDVSGPVEKITWSGPQGEIGNGDSISWSAPSSGTYSIAAAVESPEGQITQKTVDVQAEQGEQRQGEETARSGPGIGFYILVAVAAYLLWQGVGGS